MVNKTFLESVESICDKELCTLGAKRPRKGTRFFEIDNNVLCWIGLNKGSSDNFVRINPFVGVHIISIMKLKAEFRNMKYKKGETATFAIHLGELCPDVKQFIFYDDSGVELEAKRLAKTLFEFGVEFAKKFTTIESTFSEFESRVSSLGGYPESYAIALYLSEENRHKVWGFIEECKRKYKEEESEDTQNKFNAFSNWLINKQKQAVETGDN